MSGGPAAAGRTVIESRRHRAPGGTARGSASGSDQAQLQPEVDPQLRHL
jgi:hypothetical protein